MTGLLIVIQSGSFPLKGRRLEHIALEFWKQIQKDNSNRNVIEKIICNGNKNITWLVEDLEKQAVLKILTGDNFPF